MKTQRVERWAEFEAWVQTMYEVRDTLAGRAQAGGLSELLFRGQGNATWSLVTTLEREAPDCRRVADYLRLTYECKYLIETLTGRDWDAVAPPDIQSWIDRTGQSGRLSAMPGYEYLIYLRHHGFPSPLLDWSMSPYVAVFFAFSRPPTDASHVAVYCFLEHAGYGKTWTSTAPAIHGCGHTVKTHQRHVLQQCQYTLCTVVADGHLQYAPHEQALGLGGAPQDMLWKIEIPTTERASALAALDRYNLNAFSLFGTEESLMHTVALRQLVFPKISS